MSQPAPSTTAVAPLSDRMAPWWRDAVFYQIYPRSFADGNGDGTGDLIGVLDRLDHLVELGVDAIWLSPFYRSPMADGGYDVSDPCDVDPVFGTLDDFDALMAAAHARDIKVTIDVVPNHFSERHPWFEQAVGAPIGSPERDLFIFRDGRGDQGQYPPNNWPSAFGGPAWTRVADGQWYLHLFAPQQPDLNWENPRVPAEFDRILRFWMDRGVDGFRIDVANSLAKPAGLPDADLSGWSGSGHEPIPAGDPRWDQDHVHDYLRGFRRVLDSYSGDRMAVGEAWVRDPERLARYVRSDELNLTFNFSLVLAEWGADSFERAIRESLDAMADVGAPCTWVLSNHDVVRHPTRYGGGARGVARGRAAALMQLSLPGVVYLYNGDELGLPNVFLPDALLQDPTWERSGHTDRGRDGERVPIPWSGTAPPFGFTTGSTPWLPLPDDWAALTVAAQREQPESTYALYRRALQIRRDAPEFDSDDLQWLDAPSGALSYRRGTSLMVLLNAGDRPIPVPPGQVLLASAPLRDGLLAPDAAVWTRT